MTSIIENFVTIRKNRQDVLDPVQNRSAVEAVLPVIKDYKKFTTSVNNFRNHLTNTKDPHNESKSLFPEIISKIYDIYVQMTDLPFEFEDFQTEVVATPDIIELIRRICLNKKLYNQIKNTNGSVSSSALALIGKDWDISKYPQDPTTILFDNTLSDEQEFLQFAKDQNTPNRNFVYSGAFDISLDSNEILFQTSSSIPFIKGIPDIVGVSFYDLISEQEDLLLTEDGLSLGTEGENNISRNSTLPFAIVSSEENELISSQDDYIVVTEARQYITDDLLDANKHYIRSFSDGVKIRLETVYAPLETVELFTIGNSNGVITLKMNYDRSIDIFINDQRITFNSIQSSDNVIWFSFRNNEKFTLITDQDIFTYVNQVSDVAVLDTPIEFIALQSDIEDTSYVPSYLIRDQNGNIFTDENDVPFVTSDRGHFGIRECTVWDGSLSNICCDSSFTSYLINDQGIPILDNLGNPIIAEVRSLTPSCPTVTTYVSTPDGFILKTGDGELLTSEVPSTPDRRC